MSVDSKTHWVGPARGSQQAALCAWPCPYHVVHKALVDGDKEGLIGELIIQEAQEVKTLLGGIGIAQQHLGGWGDRAMGRLLP